MRQVVYAFIFMMAVGLSIVHQLDTKSGGNGANALAMATKKPAVPQPASTSSNNNYRSVTLVSDRRGYFQTDVEIDGRRIDFLVDTGAQSVALRESDAARIGIHPKVSDYNIRTQTANGVGRAARTRLNRVELKGITIYDVEAIVVPDDQLSTNLLGMTFLRRIKWSHEHDRLTLEQ